VATLPAAALAFAVALAVAPLVLRILRRVLDIPTDRSSHRQPTRRGGGLAPAVGCVVAAAIANRFTVADRDAVVVVSVGMGLIGLADDLHPAGALPRLLGQLVVATAALVWLLPGTAGGAPVTALAGLATAFWLAGYVNAFNFMDGINGLAVTQVVIAGVAWWIIGSEQHAPAFAAAGLIVAAGAAAFAPFNLPRARMFLGDVGSYFLGGWLAVAAVVGVRAGVAPEAVLAPLALFLVDSGVTLIRRVRRRQPWTQPHREHIYQRLVQAGWSHGRTTVTIGIIIAAVSALGSLSLTGVVALRVAGDGLAVLLLAGYVLVPLRRPASRRNTIAVAAAG
jgi:UDP-N-acetylmuramyl pentapeptide phosphotransferase/UDP-N-acetylglucosamine-1-phosphate transferase